MREAEQSLKDFQYRTRETNEADESFKNTEKSIWRSDVELETFVRNDFEITSKSRRTKTYQVFCGILNDGEKLPYFFPIQQVRGSLLPL